MSTEYIERGAAIKTLIAAIHNDGFQAESNIERHELREDEIEDALLSIPAADVEPVVHAHWEWKAPYMVCSACNRHSINRYQSKRCQHCGAHMDERSGE